MTMRHYFVEPQGVLMLRGNRSFGADGEHGEALLPPWPSVFAGAFRSALLADDAQTLSRFTAISSARHADEAERSERMRALLGEALFGTLGTPQRPGDFRLGWLSLAQSRVEAVQALLPLPADLVALRDAGLCRLVALQPAAQPRLTQGSTALPMTALLRVAKQLKPEDGHWLDAAGLRKHLQGQPPATSLRSDAIFKRETRLGIEIDAASRTARDGALYTSEAISLTAQTGFLVGIHGAPTLKDEGLLRLGGDGHAARWRRVSFERPAVAPITQGGRFRLILSTPGLFGAGWLPNGITRDASAHWRLRGDGFSARLACAALGRHGVVSGWDLAQWAPKPAERVVPAGSCYWFDQFEGDAGKLATWVAGGLWSDNSATVTVTAQPHAQRRAEGFNNAMLAGWI